MSSLTTTIKASMLRGLRSAWINWDYDDFMEKFFINRFPNHNTKDDDDSYIFDAYSKEKWLKFKDNPVSYMCNMDDITLDEFAKAVYKQYMSD